MPAAAGARVGAGTAAAAAPLLAAGLEGSGLPRRGGEGSGESCLPRRGGEGSGESCLPRRGGEGSGEPCLPRRGGEGSGESCLPRRGGEGSGESCLPRRGGEGSGESCLSRRGGEGSGESCLPRRGGEGSGESCLPRLPACCTSAPSAATQPPPSLTCVHAACSMQGQRNRDLQLSSWWRATWPRTSSITTQKDHTRR